MSYREQQADNIVKNKFPEYIQLLEQCFDFKRWGFRMIFSGTIPQSHPSVVYESELCRVRFVWEIPDGRDNNEITHILYGRLHAPIEKRILTWNGEQCYCWHEIHRVLEFLDGLSPQEAISRRFKLPPFMLEFYEANKDQSWKQAEAAVRMHAAIWNHYGQRLFEIFDLQRHELWQQYTSFLVECYELWPGFIAKPPMYKIA